MQITKLILALALFPAFASAQQMADGPYVFYENDSAVVKTINQRDDLASVSTKRYPVKEIPVLKSGEGFDISVKSPVVMPENTTPSPAKLLVLSDIEGEFDAGRKLLQAAGVIDNQFNWTFGTGHLVIAGDLFDRGTKVLPWIWLLYTLEDKAAAVGGKVHVILGNHDVMQLAGDFRYTDARYFKHAWLMGMGLQEVFSVNSELGRWLRSKNVIEKIGDLLVMHAGMSPALNAKQLSLTRINEITRTGLGTPRKQMPDSMQVFFNSNSPFWYRGYFKANDATMATVDSTLKQYNCRHIIVGHTITDTVIVKRFDGKVIGVDVDQHEGNHKALYIENKKYYQVDADGKRTLIMED